MLKHAMQISVGSLLEAHGFDFNPTFRESLSYTRAPEDEMLHVRPRAEADEQSMTNGSKSSEVEDEEDDAE